MFQGKSLKNNIESFANKNIPKLKISLYRNWVYGDESAKNMHEFLIRILSKFR